MSAPSVKSTAKRRVRKKPPWGIHVFLNEPWQEDKGYLKGTITFPTWAKGRPDIVLHVADCSRVVTLDFDLKDETSIADRIAKVERLRDTINEFSREALRALKQYQARVSEDNSTG